MQISLSRRGRTGLLIVLALAAAILVSVAALPFGWLRPTMERRLSDRFGSAVRIASLRRENWLSLQPVIDATDIHIDQPAWAGHGDLASIRLVRLKLHPLALLFGGRGIDVLGAEGIRLDLVRDAQGRENWRGKRHRDKPSGGGSDGTAIGTIRDAAIDYRDAKQRRHFALAVTVDPAAGLVANGTGEVDGAPVRVAIHGAAMRRNDAWPFDATIDGPLLALHATGRMARPLATDRMTLHVDARADDLKRLDRVIEAGLFGTQPVRLAADVRHEHATWTVTNLVGTVGRSDLTGEITARKHDGRTKLDGRVRFGHLTFDDLSSDAGQARALAREQAEGRKIVPGTKINIRKIDRTDGTIVFRADHVVGGRRPSSLTDLSGTMTIDHRLLTVSPLHIGLKAGAITGRVVVDQRGGQPVPHVTLALALANSRLAALAGGGGGGVDGRLDAHVRLQGDGSTIREAVGHSTGQIGLVARDGSLPRQIAALMGFDVGRGLTSGKDERATLRCAVVRLAMRGGVGSTAPLLIDTSVSQTRGTGTIVFPDERVTLTLTGTPKAHTALRLPGSVMATGTIREPHLVVPQETKSAGNIFKAIGRSITGNTGPVATDADCGRLARLALGG